LVTNTALNLSPGSLVAVSGAAGTGSFSALNGVFTAGAGTTGSTVTYTIATGLTMTITGANVSNDGIFYDPGSSPYNMGIGILPPANAKLEVFGSLVVGPGFVGALGSLSVSSANGTSGTVFFDSSGSQSLSYSSPVFTLAGGGLTVSSGNFTLSAGQVIASGAVNGSVHISTGSVPVGTTGSCVASSLAGGNTAGTFSAAVCAGGTIILTGFPSTAHGYACNAQDQTTPTDTLQQTASSVSSVTFKATTAAADVVAYQCTGF
jgi:hypothetical protein